MIVTKAIVSNRRPDIVGVRKDGRIDLFEVPSKMDDPKILNNRMDEVLKILPEDRRGDKKIIKIDNDRYPEDVK